MSCMHGGDGNADRVGGFNGRSDGGGGDQAAGAEGSEALFERNRIQKR